MELARDASARGSQEVWCCNQGMTCLLPQVEEIDRTVNSVNMYSFFWFQSGGDVLMLCVFNHMLFMDDLTLPGCSQQSGTSSNEGMLESCRVGQLPPPWCIVGCGPKWSPNCLVSKLWYRLIRHIKLYNWYNSVFNPQVFQVMDRSWIFLAICSWEKWKKVSPSVTHIVAPTARKKGDHKRSPMSFVADTWSARQAKGSDFRVGGLATLLQFDIYLASARMRKHVALLLFVHSWYLVSIGSFKKVIKGYMISLELQWHLGDIQLVSSNQMSWHLA